MDYLHDSHNYTRQRLKLASDRMKTRHDRLANCSGCYEGDAMKAWGEWRHSSIILELGT
jgi:hypothetical protein